MRNLITHSLALYLCENTEKNLEFTVFDRLNVYLNWSKKLKICTLQLAKLNWYSIASQSTEKEHLIDQLVIKSNRLVTVSLYRLKANFDKSILVKLEFSRIILK